MMARQILDVSCHCRVTHNGSIGLGVKKDTEGQILGTHM